MSPTVVRFTGSKGGVGTTVTACAYAIRLTREHRSVALVSGPDANTALGFPENHEPVGYVDHAPFVAPWDADIIVIDELDTVLWPDPHDEGPNPTIEYLVVRNDFMSLRRAMNSPVRPSMVIALIEPGRALTERDIEDCLGVPVTCIPVTPDVARNIDAGLLAHRVPNAYAARIDNLIGGAFSHA